MEHTRGLETSPPGRDNLEVEGPAHAVRRRRHRAARAIAKLGGDDTPASVNPRADAARSRPPLVDRPALRRARRAARLAAGLAFASAALSLYWTAGGTWLLDTVGGAIEDLARERSPAALALGAAAVLLKVAAGVLALALVHLPGGGRRRRLVLLANGAASAVLCLWGGANVVVGALVLAGAITPAADVDRHALRWHVFVWDMWFLVWGLALAVAVAAARRR
jgi:hypothetical protein